MKTYISIGMQCFGSLALQKLGLNGKYYPFDRMLSNPYAVTTLLDTLLTKGHVEAFNRFYSNLVCGTFIKAENITTHGNGIKNVFVNSELNLGFVHDQYDSDITQEKYIRRWARLEDDIRTNPTFIYVDPRNEAMHFSINDRILTNDPFPALTRLSELLNKHIDYKIYYFSFMHQSEDRDNIIIRNIRQVETNDERINDLCGLIPSL